MVIVYLVGNRLDYGLSFSLPVEPTKEPEPELSIKDIADRVGYRNQLYFSSEFRRFSGMSPREFRKKNAGEQGNDLDGSFSRDT